MESNPKAFKFVDLFAGLGGFHVALDQLGGECVFACELDEVLRNIYKNNFGLLPERDIRDVNVETLPDHDVLCGGFPCQSFSKAGYQEGVECVNNGDLIEYVERIIALKKPRVFMLENVPNLLKHANGDTWKAIESRLNVEYEVTHDILSPHEFGIPQVRDRMFIIGVRRDLGGLGFFGFPEPTGETPDLLKILRKNPEDARVLSEQLVRVINVWNEFVQAFPEEKELPSFPVWAMEFGATYPTKGLPPSLRGLEAMRKYKGSFGVSLADVQTMEELRQRLPHHAWSDEPFPAWKTAFINQNRALWKENKKWIKPWLANIQAFSHSHQKLEWNCKGCERDLWKFVLQVRASGLRAKRPTTAPSLIAMTTTQVPIIAWEKRYMTPRECASLQSLETLKHLPDAPTRAYKALGNAVNSRLVKTIAERLLRSIGILDETTMGMGVS